MKPKSKAGRPIEIVYPRININSLSIKRFSETLFQKGVLVVPNLGKFELRKTKSRRTYHNFAEKVITVKGQQRIHFTPLGKIKKSMQIEWEQILKNIKTEIVSLDSLHLNPENPRTIKDKAFTHLKNSIKNRPVLLALIPMVVDDTDMVLSGNMRFRAMTELGIKTVLITRASSLSEEEKKALIVIANAAFGEWDYDMLSVSYEPAELESMGIDMEKFGLGTEPANLTAGGIKKDLKPTMKIVFETPEALEMAMVEAEIFCKTHGATLSVSAGEL